MKPAPLVILDRDGTLIAEPVDQQIDSIAKLRFARGLISGLRLLKSVEARFVLWTNQDGLGSAAYPRRRYDGIQRILEDVLAAEGLTFEATLLCPHRAEEGCACRKPSPKLIEALELPWSKEACVVIGDRDSDMRLARVLGVPGIKVRTSPSSTAEAVPDFLGAAERALMALTKSKFERRTLETRIRCEFWRSARPDVRVKTGLGFFDHMLSLAFFHAGLGARLTAKGDLWIDDHHLIEDVAIVVGQALARLLGANPSLRRYGFALPMDDARAACWLDLSGRVACEFDVPFRRESIGDLSTEMIPHFFLSLAQALRANVHIKAKGRNEHHLAEAVFKTFGRAIGSNLTGAASSALSSKGVLWI